ncbi:MAG: FecR domain-containing protein [Bacteroidia bacterium]|jgi:ferric-dicitrate binding protein FerR (iron transport regulator)
MISEEVAYQIMARILAGEAAPGEKKELDSWVQAYPENRKAYESFSVIWNTAQQKKIEVNVDAAWEKVNHRIKPSHQLYTTTRIWQWAAIFLAVSVIGFTIVRFAMLTSLSVQTAANEVKQVVLPDGSKIWLHEGSQLTYQNNFWNTKRNLTLTGMAYFDVQRDEERPFTIVTRRNSITVLGTSFEVMAYAGDSNERVTVTSGHVQFGNKDQGMLDLKTNQAGIISTHQAFIVKEESASELTAWHKGKLVFNNETMDQVMNKIARYFHIRYVFLNPEIKGCHFTGTFENPKLKQVMDMISSALELSWKQDKKQVEIAGEGCKAKNGNDAAPVE